MLLPLAYMSALVLIRYSASRADVSAKTYWYKPGYCPCAAQQFVSASSFIPCHKYICELKGQYTPKIVHITTLWNLPKFREWQVRDLF